MLRSYDLIDVLSDLEKEDHYLGLAKEIRLLASSISSHRDILEAKRAMNNINLVFNGLSSIGKVNELPYIVESLANHAIILYCKVTHTSTKDRYGVGTGKLTPDQAASHKRITDLRDKVIAHFGKGAEQEGGFWNKDHIAIHFKNKRFEFTYPSLRAAYKQSIIQDIINMLNVADKHCQKVILERQKILSSEITKKISEKGGELMKKLENHPFIEENFFGQKTPPGSEEKGFSLPAGAKISERAKHNNDIK